MFTCLKNNLGINNRTWQTSTRQFYLFSFIDSQFLKNNGIYIYANNTHDIFMSEKTKIKTENDI